MSDLECAVGDHCSDYNDGYACCWCDADPQDAFSHYDDEEPCDCGCEDPWPTLT